MCAVCTLALLLPARVCLVTHAQRTNSIVLLFYTLCTHTIPIVHNTTIVLALSWSLIHVLTRRSAWIGSGYGIHIFWIHGRPITTNWDTLVISNWSVAVVMVRLGPAVAKIAPELVTSLKGISLASQEIPRREISTDPTKRTTRNKTDRKHALVFPPPGPWQSLSCGHRL